MDNVFVRIDAWITALAFAAAMVVAWRVGLWRGRRLLARDGDTPPSKFEDAGLALLGLLLAFTFSMALGKNERRRDMLVADSNAIGDFYTSATMLQEPARTKLQDLIREYAVLRLAVARNPQDLDERLPRFTEMQNRMTALAADAIHEGTPVAVPLVNTLNEVTSSQASRLAAVRDRLPWPVILLLLLAATVSTSLIGSRQAASKTSGLTDGLSFVLLVTLVVYLTLDLNQPRRGLIKVSDEPLERLLVSIAK